MSRESALLAAVTGEPTSTSELYDQVGYATLTRIGLVPYPRLPGRAGPARLHGEHRRAPGAGRLDGVADGVRGRRPPGAGGSPGPTTERRIDEP